VNRRYALFLAFVAFGVLSSAVYGPHVIRGGWYYDDWDFIAHIDLARGAGLGAAMRAAGDISYRPTFCAVFFLMYLVGGTGQAAYLLFGLVAAGANGLLLYLVLRRIGIALLIAAAAGVVLVVVPAVDAARLWAAAMPSGIAIAIYLGGVLCALRGLDAAGPRARVTWHVAALALYAVAAFMSELVIPLIALSPVLYAIHAGRRKAVVRGPGDVAVAAVALVYMAVVVPDIRPAEGSLSYLLDRAAQVLSAGLPVLRDQLPLASVLWGPVGVMLLSAAAGGIAGARLWREARAELVLAAAGFAFMVAGVVMLLPAEPYYVPRTAGVGDRLAIAAAPGFSALFAGVAALTARGLSALVQRPRARVALLAGITVVTSATMAVEELRAQAPWADSWKQSQNVLSAVRHALPELPRGAAVVTFRHATLLPGDTPVFLGPADLQGALRLTYRDETIVARPFLAGNIVCEPGTLLLKSLPGSHGDHRVAYGHLYFTDVATYTAREIPGPRECARGISRLGVG
jgi:hypothetical protein